MAAGLPAIIEGGGMAEWLKAAVLKTVNGETRSGVRIPLPPPSGLAAEFLHRHPLNSFRPADLLNHPSEFPVRPHFRRHVQQHRKIPRRLEAQPHLRLAWLAAE